MPSPFFSGRIPQELYDRIENHIKLTGESKTQVLITALSKYVGYELSVSDNNVSEIIDIKARLTSLEQMMNEIYYAKSDNTMITPMPIASDKADSIVVSQLELITDSITEPINDTSDNNLITQVDFEPDNKDDNKPILPKLEPMTGAALSKRLEIPDIGSVKGKYKNDVQGFINLTKAKDPDAIGWEFRDKKYHPIYPE